MRWNNCFIPWCSVVILLLIGSCVPARETVTAPKETPSPNLMPTSAVTLSSTPSPTLADASILGNNQCLLPCWQEVTPGISSDTDLEIKAQALLGMPLSTESRIFQGQKYSTTYAYRDFSIDGTEIHFGLGTYSRSNRNTIEVLDIWANVVGHQSSDTSNGYDAYSRLFKEYSLQNVLTTHGIPEKVLTFGEIYYEDFLQDRNALHLRLLYSAKGIYVSYDMPLKRNGEEGIACLIDADFSLWLTSSDLSQSYEPWWENSQGYTNFSSTFDTPIEEALGMNIESFYETFSKENPPCITTPIKTWLP